MYFLPWERVTILFMTDRLLRNDFAYGTVVLLLASWIVSSEEFTIHQVGRHAEYQFLFEYNEYVCVQVSSYMRAARTWAATTNIIS